MFILRNLALFLWSIPFMAGTCAVADEGVLEINQACAASSGCFPGDAPGFPVEIANTGRYRLTSSLSVPTGTMGISYFGTPNVSIDLNGFELAGPGVCTGYPATSCTGNAAGILGGPMTTIHDGTVRGFSVGISARARGAAIRNVSVQHNGDGGIVVGPNARVTDCRAFQNRANGIFLTDEDNSSETFPNAISIADNNIASGNGFSGIRVGFVAARVTNNVADNNLVSGISFVGNGAVAGNVLFDNGVESITFGSAIETGVNLCDGSTDCVPVPD